MFVDLNDGCGCQHAGVPAGNGAVFGGEEEDGRLAGSNRKVCCTVKNRAGRASQRAQVQIAGRNLDHQWLDGAGIAVVKGAQTGPIVADPPCAIGGTGQTPGIYQIWVSHRGNPCHVRGEVRLSVLGLGTVRWPEHFGSSAQFTTVATVERSRPAIRANFSQKPFICAFMVASGNNGQSRLETFPPLE